MIHVVQQGECFSSIAARYGMKSWKELYEHPDNAELAKKRPNPNILLPGDEVNIPDPETRFVSRPTERRHRFVVPIPHARLRLALLDAQGNPREQKRYVVMVGDRKLEGRSKAGGLVEEDVPATATSATIHVWLTDDPDDDLPDVERELLIGHLDPVESVTGVQGRLSNLGYACTVTGEVDDATLVATRLFRARNDLPAVETDEDDGAGDEGPDEDATSCEALDPSAQYQRLVDDSFRRKLVDRYERA